MKQNNRMRNKQNGIRVTLSKKILLGFLIAVIVSIAAFQLLRKWLAIIVILILAAAIYFLVDRFLIRPIQALTLSVIESRPTADGFEYHAPEIRTGDELELLSDALKRMAADMNRRD